MKTTPRPLVTLKVDSYAQAPKTEAELALLNLGAKAASMKNAEFAGHPDVIRAAADAEAWRVRLKRLYSYPAKRTVIAKLVDGIEVELHESKERYRIACLDAFLNGDHDFTAAIAAKERVFVLENRLDAARTAKLDLDRSPPELDALEDMRISAEAKFNGLLFELKKQAVLQQNAIEA